MTEFKKHTFIRRLDIYTRFRNEKKYRNREFMNSSRYKELLCFEEAIVEHLTEIFLPCSNEKKKGELSMKERMKMFLRYVTDLGFQTTLMKILALIKHRKLLGVNDYGLAPWMLTKFKNLGNKKEEIYIRIRKKKRRVFG